VRYVIAVTGASGIAYGLRLLECIEGEKVLVLSEMGKRVLVEETGMRINDVERKANVVYSDDDLFAPIASGSYKHDGMIICPCSESTMGKIASGIADTLITRAAAVAMKEGRKLIIVPRETPLSAIMIENELKLARAGAIILPASPGFYSKPTTIAEMIDFIVGKILDQLGQENSLYHRWNEKIHQ
jgi:4-hydroxy-3-polyprenylbenzoate decarboxylase